MASGGKGLHVVVPLDGSQSFDDLGDFAGGIARGLAKADPKRYVAVASKEKRRGRIFVDWLRNRPTRPPFCRGPCAPAPTASVAVPLAWDEVPDLDAPTPSALPKRRRDPIVDGLLDPPPAARPQSDCLPEALRRPLITDEGAHPSHLDRDGGPAQGPRRPKNRGP